MKLSTSAIPSKSAIPSAAALHRSAVGQPPSFVHHPGVTYHVVLRGHHHSHSFFEGADYQKFINLLNDARLKYGLHVHAYTLLPARGHFLVTPSRDDSMQLAMNETILRFEAYANRANTRRLHKWTGWYNASEIVSPGFMLSCYRYVERTPVMEKLVTQPADWFWSSARAHLQGAVDELLTPHSAYTALGASEVARRMAYGTLFGGVPRRRKLGVGVKRRESIPGSAL